MLILLQIQVTKISCWPVPCLRMQGFTMVEISNLKINKNFVYINLQNWKHIMTQMCL